MNSGPHTSRPRGKWLSGTSETDRELTYKYTDIVKFLTFDLHVNKILFEPEISTAHNLRYITKEHLNLLAGNKKIALFCKVRQNSYQGPRVCQDMFCCWKLLCQIQVLTNYNFFQILNLYLLIAIPNKVF